jgi:hypothetical protein
MGGALVWAGVATAAASRQRVVLAVGAVLLLGVGVARWERADRWHRAGRDADAIAVAIREGVPVPSGPLVLGPRPIVDHGIAAFADSSNLEGALQLVYGSESVRARVAHDDATWAAVPGDRRFDPRPVSTLDDRG